MREPSPIVVDWVHPPTAASIRSLWHPLHDAELVACVSDRRARTIRLSLDISQLVDGELGCEVLLRGVTSARATVSVPWPGKCAPATGLSGEEQSRVIREYQAKWRNESIGWDAFEAAVAAGSIWLMNADLAIGPDSRALMFEGTLEGREGLDDQWSVVSIASLTSKSPSGGSR